MADSSSVSETMGDLIEEEGQRAIRIENVRKTFENGSIVAVENIDLEIQPDEFVTLLGPSGCGKTTILRCISGLITPDRGKIFIGDQDVTQEEPKDRDLAFVFQENTLFPHMTVRENIQFGLDRGTDLPAEEKLQRVEEVADLLGIGEFLDREPSDLSGGQQQRVSIGRAMVMEPAGFLLDEPFSDLDANLRSELQTEIKQLQQDLERPMVFVTHDQEEAMSISDKIVVIRDGVVQQIGSPHEVYTDPNNKFVARFIGSPNANFIDCEITTQKDGELYLTNDLFSMPAPETIAQAVSDQVGEMITISIRPEYVEIVDSGYFEGEIDLIESQGSHDTIHFTAGDYQLRSSVPYDQVPDTETIEIDFTEERMMAFDMEGSRLA